MPEMPEVETLARTLRKKIVGKQIAGVRLSGLSLRKPISDAFTGILTCRTIRKIFRRGKYIIVEMEPRAFWLIHLGMSGRLLYHKSACAGDKHTHAVIRFSDSTELEYRDHRRFGLLNAYEVLDWNRIPEISSLGADPFDPGFTEQWLESLLKKSRQEIKSFLLDQRKLAGIGNIYASEALFLSRIHPARRCCTINRRETIRLKSAIQKILSDAVRRRGTSFSDFMDSDGKPGNNRDCLFVFLREGEKCLRCGTVIQRLRQGNRSSYICSRCQI
jgi:formamidopyrimidine-DNA glycosylase